MLSVENVLRLKILLLFDFEMFYQVYLCVGTELSLYFHVFMLAYFQCVIIGIMFYHPFHFHN